MAPTSPAVRVRITVIRTPRVGIAGANRIETTGTMSMPAPFARSALGERLEKTTEEGSDATEGVERQA